MGWLAAVLLVIPQDLEAVLERLKSADPAERDQAVSELIARGPGALPSLKRHEAHPDSEIRGRIRRAIDEIGRRERVRCLRPDPIRVTLTANEMPLKEVLDKVFPRFGPKPFDPSFHDPDLVNRRVTLDLKDATLWEAVDAVNAAAGVEVDVFDSRGVRIWKPGREERPRFAMNVGDARVTLHVDKPQDDKGDRDIPFWVSVALPVGSCPVSWGIDECKLSDENRREIPVQADPFRGKAARSALLNRRADLPMSGQVWQGSVRSHDLRDARTARFQGKVLIRYPHDVERHEFDVRDFREPVRKVVQGATFTLKSFRHSEGKSWSFSEETQDSGSERPVPFLIWGEDADGRWRGDALAGRLGGTEGRSGGSSGAHEGGKTRVVKLVLALLRGEDLLTIPFAFKDVPLGASPRK